MIKKTLRDSNLELLRIVAMTFIVLHHFIVHGFQLSKLHTSYHSVFPVNNPVLSYEFLISNSFFIVGVNLFLLISGYFSIRLRWKSIINLLIICVFYDYLQLLISDIYNGNPIMMRWEPITEVFTRSGWFITCYMALMLLSPGINTAIANFGHKQRLGGIIVLTVLNFWFGYYLDTELINQSGYSMMQFVFMYYTGRILYIYQQKFDKPAMYYFIGYVVVSVVLSAFVILQFKTKDYVSMWQLYHYNNPLIVLSAVLLFLTFKNIQLKSRFINWISSSILAVYLIHEGDFMRKILHSSIQSTIAETGYSSLHSVLVFAGYFLAIMAGSIFIDKLRQLITDPIVNRLSSLIEKIQDKTISKTKFCNEHQQ